MKIEDIKARTPKGIILSGGPASVYTKRFLSSDTAVFDLGLQIRYLLWNAVNFSTFLVEV